jgi:aminobenzoyl-glutamate transport protein
MESQPEMKKGLFFRFIEGVEIIGNKFPNPFYLFTIMIVVAIVSSILFAGASVTYTTATAAAGEKVTTATVKSLLNKDTLVYVMTNMHRIYFTFSPLMNMGFLIFAIGLAEEVGLFSSFIKSTIAGAKPGLVFAIVSFVAINSNTASTAGMLGCTAVAAAVFASMGYNPWLGIILAYAASNAGLTANILVGSYDVVLSGVSETVCKAVGIDTSLYPVHILQNWYFMFTSAFLLTVVFAFVTNKFVYGFFGEPKDLSLIVPEGSSNEKELTDVERKALHRAGIAVILFVAVLVAACVPANSIFRAANGTLIPKSPLMSSVLFLLFLFFVITGIVYGRTAGTIKEWNDLPKIFGRAIASMKSFMVISLPASLFIYLFNSSNIPTVLGATGASWIKSTGITGFPLMLMIILLTTFLNLFLTSGSAKWMVLAPILIPMFYAVGFSPALTLTAYRIGDSATNAIAPVSTDIAMILGLLNKYNTDKSKVPGMGTVFAGCLPYSIASIVTLTIQLLVWWILGLPLGPGVQMLVK